MGWQKRLQRMTLDHNVSFNNAKIEKSALRCSICEKMLYLCKKLGFL